MCTDKQSVAAYFDCLAADWDEANTYSDAAISQILDLAEIRPGVHILDVACGTGILFPAYLQRGAASVTGVDFSPGMIARAKTKFRQPEVHLIRADILACRFDRPFDRCMVCNALPYFASPASLLRRLAGCVKPGGRITLAHCLWKASTRHQACPHSFPLPEPANLARMMAPWFLVDVQISGRETYVVSGLRNDRPACFTPAAECNR